MSFLEIRNYTDWIFVQEADELLLPVNFDANSRNDWCMSFPPLITRIIEQMLTTATRHMLQTWTHMMSYAKLNSVLDSMSTCPLGMSLCPYAHRCKPITALSIPVHLWLRGPHASWEFLPTVRSNYAGADLKNLKFKPSDGQEERWRSLYQTRYNPPLSGLMTVHANDVDPKTVFTVLAPRQFHGGLSLELIRQQFDNHEISRENMTRLMARDFKLVHLSDAYHNCMQGL